MSTENIKALLRNLGLPDDGVEEVRAGAPGEPVDEALISAFYAGQLTGVDAMDVAFRLTHEEVWLQAGNKVLLERAKAGAAAERVVSLALLLKWVESRRRPVAFTFAVAAMIVVAFFAWGRPEQFRDGGNLVAFRSGRVSGLDAYPQQWRDAAADAMQEGIKPPKAYDQIEAALPVHRSDGAPLSEAIIAPYLTAVREQQPELNWKPLPGATSYRVEVAEAGTDAPLLSQETDTTNWKVSQPLEPGRAYQWRVYFAVGDDSFVAPKATELPAAFWILDDAALQRLAADEKDVSGSKLLQGLLYAREGLADEAEAVWGQLLAENPTSDLVEKLLADLRAVRTKKAE
jgi:hypothetical protein